MVGVRGPLGEEVNGTGYISVCVPKDQFYFDDGCVR